MTPFIHAVQIFFGPLTQIQGGGPQSAAIVINSQGRAIDQRIIFKTSKNTMGSSPNMSEISIYNLSQDTKQALSRRATNIQLQVGYLRGDPGVQTIAEGAITAPLLSQREEADVITKVITYDGGESLGIGKISRSYEGQQELAVIVKDVADQLKGIRVNRANIKLTKLTGSKGLSLAGKASRILDKLAQQFGFSWEIRDGVFRALPDEAAAGGFYNISTENGNLMNATPMVENMLQTIIGLDLKVRLDPRLQPFDIINLKSTVNPSLNGQYQITNLTHSGDTHGDVWETDIQCLYNLDRLRLDGKN